MGMLDEIKARTSNSRGNGSNASAPVSSTPTNASSNSAGDDDKEAQNQNEHIAMIRANLKKRIFGQDEVIEIVLAVLLAGGNMIFNDLPGTAKTWLIRCLNDCFINTSFGRVQFTPDLMPHDLTGGVQLVGGDRFEEVDGPMFVNFLLADEINRAAPKVQSALLEAMEERQVTRIGLDGKSSAHVLPDPHATFATQNPLDQQGTFPLPEAQLDRFMVMLCMQMMGEADTVRMLVERRTTKINGQTPFEENTLVTKDQLKGLTKKASAITVVPDVDQWIAEVSTASKSHEALRAGFSPRSLIQWMELAMAYEVVSHDGHELTKNSLKKVAPHVFGHRLYLTDEAAMDGVTATQVTEDIINPKGN